MRMILQLSNSPPLSTVLVCTVVHCKFTVHVLPLVRLWGGGGSVFWHCVQFVSYSFAPHRTCLVSPAVLAKQQCSQVCRVLSHRRWRSSLVLYVQLLDFECSRGVIHWAVQIVNSCSYWNTFVFRLLKHKLCLQYWYLAHKYIIQFVEWIISYLCGGIYSNTLLLRRCTV
jgi:hypothetical protein